MADDLIRLTKEERAKLAAWLKQEARADAAMAEKMKLINTPEPVQERMRTRALAKQMVAEELANTEEWKT